MIIFYFFFGKIEFNIINRLYAAIKALQDILENLVNGILPAINNANQNIGQFENEKQSEL